MTLSIGSEVRGKADFRPLSILVGVAFFMEQLDATIISPVIPDLALAYGVDPLSLNLTLTVYLLCSLIFIPFSAPLASRFGTRTIFQCSLGLFTFSAVLCAMSPNLGALIFARALQGAAAALMVPVGRTAIVYTTDKAELVQALAWMITPAMLGPMLGPPLGGLISSYLSWHWVFLINVPIGLIGWWSARRIMPQRYDENDTPVRAGEWLLISMMLIFLVTLFEWVRTGAPPVRSLSLLSLLLALVAIYAWRFRRCDRPMLDFRLLSYSTFSAGFWGGALSRVGYGAFPFLLPLMMQIGMGYSALESGAVLLVSGAVALFMKTRTAAALRRWGFRSVLLWNGLLCGVALALCAAVGISSAGVAVLMLIAAVAGLFRAVQFNALTAIAYAELPTKKVASATTLNTMGWQLAIMAGIALSATVADVSALLGGRALPSADDFAWAFLVITLFTLAAIPAYSALSPDAGAALSGHTDNARRGRQRAQAR